MDSYEPLQSDDRDDRLLAPYAMRTRDSRGRKHPEPPHSFRSIYQRDRDRIVHATAFRRLMYKTQVLVNQTSDYHRTRLTHTLEVAQIARTIARQLGLNEDLTEAVALAHDLGHPPFGHAGERALAECMIDHGGFEHNLHGLRILEELEYRYSDFPGLNLSHEVLESQAMHSKAVGKPEIRAYLDVGRPLLEAQVVDAADSLAYDTHDLDDALSVGLIAFSEIGEIPFCRRVLEKLLAKKSGLSETQLQPALVRGLIEWQVNDLLEFTRSQLRLHRIASVADVRACPELIVGLSPEVLQLKSGLEAFLHRRVYRHHRVVRMVHKGQRMIRMLFEEFRQHPAQMPERYFKKATEGSPERTACDYLAGMTDRYAQDEFMRLFHPYTPV